MNTQEIKNSCQYCQCTELLNRCFHCQAYCRPQNDKGQGGQARKKPITISYRIAQNEELIQTLEGEMIANIGDYIITGINGEIYPCKPDIFLKTYDFI